MAFESKRNLRPPPRVPLRTVQGVDYPTQKIQQAVVEATKPARDYQPTKGRRITVTATAAGPVTVSHGLGRKPLGYQVEKRSASCTDHLTGATTREMTLDISAAAELTVWVY